MQSMKVSNEMVITEMVIEEIKIITLAEYKYNYHLVIMFLIIALHIFLPYLPVQAETDEMYQKIKEYDEATKAHNAVSDTIECEIRDTGKKVLKLGTGFEDTLEALQESANKMELAETEFKDKEDDVNAQTRRVFLLEEESRFNMEKLAVTVMKLATISKDTDVIVKEARHWESATMNNEGEVEDLDKHTRDTIKMGKSISSTGFKIKSSSYRC